MLADALKAYDKKVAAGEAKPPSQPTAPRHEPPSLAGLHVSAPSGLISQSLPSGGNHFSMLPPKPRPRPSMPNISHLPILELPEPSPHSCSLLDEHPMQHSSMIGQPETGADPMADDVGGTSMLEPTASSSRVGSSYMYAASAPATMLWGPAPTQHRLGGNAMGGRTPSKTLLEAMSARDIS